MTAVLITAPDPLVDLDTVKAHLRVEDGDWDTLLDAYIAAACAHIDGPGGWLGRSIGSQVIELRLAALDLSCQQSVQLPYGPVTAVASFKYDDADSVEQTFAGASYRLTARGALELLSTAAWPTMRDGADAARIRYSAGGAVIPPAVTAAVLLMVGDLWRFRETVGEVTGQIKMSASAENLLSPLRAWK